MIPTSAGSFFVKTGLPLLPWNANPSIRNMAESISAFSEITFSGVNIVSVADGIDTSKKGAKMPFYFKSVMNEFFLDSLREQVLRGQKGQVERGYSAGGRLYGYSYEEIFDPTGAKDRMGRLKRLGVTIKIDAEQANIVKKIFEMRIKGHGLKSIAKYLNESKVSPPRPEKRGRISLTWCPSSIREILRNEKYIGDWTWNKTQWNKYPGSKKRKKIDKAKEEWVINRREDLRIISDELWLSVRNSEKSLNTTRVRGYKGQFTGYYGNNTREKYLFSGLLKCGVCGGSMVAITSKKIGSYLVCGLHRTRGDMACPNNTGIDRHLVEKTLLSEISKKLLEPEILQRIVEKTNRKLQALLSEKTRRY